LLASTLPVRIDWSTPLLAAVLALPVITEDGFRLVRRWLGTQRRTATAHTLTSCARSSALTASVAVAAAVVIATAALTGASLTYGGIATLSCLAVSYMGMRSWLIVAVTRRRAETVATH
jgi:hypothetical protein